MMKKTAAFLLAAVLAISPVSAVDVDAVQAGIGEKLKELIPGNDAGDETVEENDFTPKRGDKSPVKAREGECEKRKPERFRCDENFGKAEESKKANEAKKSEESKGQDESKKAVQTSAEAQSWYCKHMKSTARPPIPPEMSFIENYNGYFLGPDEKVIYLTFDAGYENGNVEKILDVLKAEQVPGAFFILENLVTSNTALVKRMAEEGHTVCNHTAKHRDMTKVGTKEEFAAELDKMNAVYKDKIGLSLSPYYRPPEGKFNEQNLKWAKELGYSTIFWSFAYADWDNGSQMNPDKAVEKIISNTHNGEIILLHPTSATNAEILPTLIKKWKEMGYRFGTLDELTGNNSAGAGADED